MTEVLIMSASRSRLAWLEREIAAQSTLHVAGTATTFPFLRSLLYEMSPDVVVADLASITEAENTREWLMNLIESVALVLLTAAPDVWLFNQIVRNGKGGVVGGDSSTEQLIRAIQSVSSGLLAFDPFVISQEERPDNEVDDLSPREFEVLQLLAEGLANRQIADRLNISEHTIKFHIASILGKLRASTRTEAVSRGFRAGLIEL